MRIKFLVECLLALALPAEAANYVQSNPQPGALSTGGPAAVIVNQDGTAIVKSGVAFSGAPSNPTGTTSATAVMGGLGTTCKFTPLTTGKFILSFVGTMQNGTALDGGRVQGAYGTGMAPANGDAFTGTAFTAGASQSDGAGTVKIPFTQIGVVSGLTIGTTYWMDIQFWAVTGGTESPISLTCNAMEVP